MACTLVEKEDGCAPGYTRNAAGQCVKCVSTGINAVRTDTDYLNLPAGALQVFAYDAPASSPTPSAPASSNVVPPPSGLFSDGKSNTRTAIIVGGILVLVAVSVFVYVKFFKK